MSGLEDKVNFNRIRYANCWEDADVLMAALQLKPGSRILSVAAAGDNALALAATSPERLLAVDLSAPQLFLTELKMMAFRRLNYEELLGFLGVREASARHRKNVFEKISTSLPEKAGLYWQSNSQLIEQGIIHQGKFEHYFQIFRKWLLPLVHSERSIDALLQPKTESEQSAFYAQQWNTWRWKLLMNLFFSKPVMGRYGRDPEFLKQVTIDVPAYIRQKAEEHLQSDAATKNYFLHYIFKGAFGYELPFYLRPENFEAIRRNIDKIQLVQADVDAVITSQAFDVCCLSNIYEYFPDRLFETTVNRWSLSLSRGTRLAFWNLMVPRSCSEILPASFVTLPVNTPTDNGFFYSKFLLEQKI